MDNKNETSKIGQEIQKKNSVMPPQPDDDTMAGEQNQRNATEGTSDDLANFDSKASKNQDVEREGEEPRRYDEADPNWKNPDVQMQNQNQSQDSSLDVNTPHGGQLS